MKEEVSGMGRPNSRAELCAWVLGLMGAFFLLFGGAVLLWDIPVGGAGPDWAFLPIGAALLAAGEPLTEENLTGPLNALEQELRLEDATAPGRPALQTYGPASICSSRAMPCSTAATWPT